MDTHPQQLNQMLGPPTEPLRLSTFTCPNCRSTNVHWRSLKGFARLAFFLVHCRCTDCQHRFHRLRSARKRSL